ncbi:MAG: penicillin-binding protein 2 [Pseudomonadota bacterium]
MLRRAKQLFRWIYKAQHSLSYNLISWNYCASSRVLRLIIVTLCFSIGFVIICSRLVYLAAVAHDSKQRYAASHQPRKEIMDRNNNILAINVPIASLFANPQHMVNPAEDFAKLKKVLPNIDVTKLLEDLGKDKTFCWIKHDITPKEEQKINDLGIAGLYFEKEEKRIYTYGNLLSHIIGYVGRGNDGLAGLEKSYNNFLNHDHVPNKEGDKPLQLTIDVRVQNIVAEELDKAIKQYSAQGGVGVVVDVNTGEIIAMVSKPDFDPHNPGKAKPDNLFNRASLGIYEIGSVAKSFTLAIAFDTNTITMHDAYNLSNFRVANFNLKDTHKATGWHSVPEIFLHSSNIGVAQIALESGRANFQSYYKKLGLMDKLQVDLPERGTPLYPKNLHWSDLSLATMSYGYSISISALHFVQAMLPVVNGGLMYPLALVKQNDPPEGTRIFKESTSEVMRKLMRLVVSHGTGKKAEVAGYLVGGKTGTAEVQVGKRYVKNQRRASFFGIVPAVDPKYAIYVMLDRPQGTKETFGFAGGGWTATPTGGSIISRMVALFGMQPYDPNDLEIQKKLHVDYQVNSDT